MAYAGTTNVPSAAMAAGRNTNSIMQGFVDRGPWSYWDDLYFPNATQLPTQIAAFTIPINGTNNLGAVGGATNGVAKTKLQTNMVRGNQFGPPRCLLLFAIGFQFSSDFLKADIDKIMNSCYIEFKIDEKVFHEGWLADFPAGGGLSGVSVNSGESAWVNGLPSPRFQRRYADWAKYIAPEQQFSLVLNFGGGGIAAPTLGTGSTSINYPGNLRVVLDGLTDRSVQ
jgi:hypothetical protein